MKKLMILLLILIMISVYMLIPNSETVIPCYIAAIDEVMTYNGSVNFYMLEKEHLYEEIKVALKELGITEFADVHTAEIELSIEKSRVSRYFATIEVGVGTGSLSGQGYKIRLRYKNQKWQVFNVENIWIA